MSLIETIQADLKRMEGYRQFPYKDTLGHLTIGYGRNLESSGIDLVEAEYLLRNDVIETLRQLDEKLDCWDSLTEARQSVLANMAFNMGIAGLLTFKKMLAALEESRYLDAAKEMLDSKWASQVGHRATELSEIMAIG